MERPEHWVVNGVGRRVPTQLNGKAYQAFGVEPLRPEGRMAGASIPFFADSPGDGDKRVASLTEALVLCGLKDGMTLSTHHHLRDGDLMAQALFEAARKLGVRDLVWFPSAAFPCHEALIPFLEDGTIARIEGSMNGALGRFCTEGRMRGTAMLRSHGGRVAAIQNGEVRIDIALIAAPSADAFGNAHGLSGPSACGGLGYALPDSQYADKVIVVTDHLVPFPCLPMQIEGNRVDCVVVVDRIGVAEKIVSGTTRITSSPDRLLIADLTARFCQEAGLLVDGFSFQAGAGGTSLAIGDAFHRIMKAQGIRARFAVGGTTRYAVQMLEEGTLDVLLDAQAFDLDAVASLGRNPGHVAISVHHCYNPNSRGNYTTMTDVMILGATEIDLGYNGNVVTHSDGYLLHGIGGWQNCLHARCVILPVPLFRDRVPVIRERVTTLCGPGSMIDVVVCERGIAVNPAREDLLERLRGSRLPLRTIESLYEEAISYCGLPEDPVVDRDRVVAGITWVDGSLIDVVHPLVTDQD